MKTGSVTKTYAYYTNTNKVKNTDGAGNDYVYDATGNMTQSVPKNINQLSYDKHIQMTKSVTMVNNDKMFFTYDGTERRVLKKDKNNNQLYLYDGLNPIIENMNARQNKEYVYGPTGVIAIKTDGQINWIIKDHLGSTRVVANMDNTVLASMDYAPYGSVIRYSGNSPMGYAFTGQEYDSTTGMWNFKARMYDSELGIFYARDPMGQGASPFAYCGNSPIIQTDKDGKLFFLAPILVGAAIGAVTSSAVYSATALATGNFELKNLGKAAAFGAVGGAISGGVGAIGTGLGSFGQSAAFNILSNTASYAGTTAAFGGKITAGGLVGSVIGGALGGAIPGFSGTNSNNALVNIGAELVYGASKGSFVGGFSGAVGAAIDGKDPGKGFMRGLKCGAVGGATISALNIAAFGHAIKPDPIRNKKAISALQLLEETRTITSKPIGQYEPVYRSGGAFGWLSNKVFGLNGGMALGRNLLMLDRSDETFIHETAHYYQQIQQGYGGFLWRGAAEQWFMDSPYNTPGTNEYDASWTENFYLNLVK